MQQFEDFSRATCDQCGPAVKAKFWAQLPSGSGLTYCGHHTNKYRDSIEKTGGVIWSITLDDLGDLDTPVDTQELLQDQSAIEEAEWDKEMTYTLTMYVKTYNEDDEDYDDQEDDQGEQTNE